MTNQLQYLQSVDGFYKYKVNHELQRITRISNNKRTFPEWTELDEIMNNTTKLSKQKWRMVENTFYISQKWEWEYNGERYRISDIPFEKEQLQPNPNWQNGGGYPSLAFNNGQIWETAICGNYFPQMPLIRTDKDGKVIRRWTNIKYVLNFEKIS